MLSIEEIINFLLTIRCKYSCDITRIISIDINSTKDGLPKLCYPYSREMEIFCILNSIKYTLEPRELLNK